MPWESMERQCLLFRIQPCIDYNSAFGPQTEPIWTKYGPDSPFNRRCCVKFLACDHIYKSRRRVRRPLQPSITLSAATFVLYPRIMEFHTATRANSLNALALRAANNDFSSQNFYQTYRPSLVFYHDPKFAAEQRVLIARDYVRLSGARLLSPGVDVVYSPGKTLFSMRGCASSCTWCVVLRRKPPSHIFLTHSVQPRPAHLPLPVTGTNAPTLVEAASTLPEISDVTASSEGDELPLDVPVVDICLEELEQKK